MNILAGSTLGGGTRVNWQASFRTPDHVRREWAEEHGLKAVASERFAAALDAVCTRLGVTTGTSQATTLRQDRLSLCCECMHPYLRDCSIKTGIPRVGQTELHVFPALSF